MAVVAEVARRVAGLLPQELAQLSQRILWQCIGLVAAAAEPGRARATPDTTRQAEGTDP